MSNSDLYQNPDEPVHGINLLDLFDSAIEDTESMLEGASTEKKRTKVKRTILQMLSGEPKYIEEESRAQQLTNLLFFIKRLRENIPKNDRFCVIEEQMPVIESDIGNILANHGDSVKSVMEVVRHCILLSRTKCEGCLKTEQECRYRKKGIKLIK